jgi:hypothetical protein
MARVYLAQAQAVRRFNDGRHERLMRWAADRRRRHAEALHEAAIAAAAQATTTPIQGDLFEGMF